MKKYLFGVGAAAILATTLASTAQAENEATLSQPIAEEVSIILEEPPGKMQIEDVGELVFEMYIGGEQRQIVRNYEYNDVEAMENEDAPRMSFYEEFELPKSIAEKVDKLPQDEQLTAAKKMLADYYKEAENWTGLTSLLMVNPAKHSFLDIRVHKELEESVLEDHKVMLKELKENKTKDLSEADYKEIWSYVDTEQKINNKYRTLDVIVDAAEERYEQWVKDSKENGKFIPIALFTFITLLVGITLLFRR